MSGRFDGRVVAVTGAAAGLGRATARRLADEGAVVACIDIDLEGVEGVAKELNQGGRRARAYHCDVSDPTAVQETFAALTTDLGGLHALCNVAGIGMFSHTTEVRYEDWSRIIAVNLTGPFLTCQAAIPHLVRVKGNIVNVASDGGTKGLPFAAPYSASKGGLVMLTKSLAVELMPMGIRVNAVSPGGMQTEMTAGWRFPPDAPSELLARFITPFGVAAPEDVASVIAFVASDEACRLTGAVIAADGGTTA